MGQMPGTWMIKYVCVYLDDKIRLCLIAFYHPSLVWPIIIFTLILQLCLTYGVETSHTARWESHIYCLKILHWCVLPFLRYPYSATPVCFCKFFWDPRTYWENNDYWIIVKYHNIKPLLSVNYGQYYLPFHTSLYAWRCIYIRNSYFLNYKIITFWYFFFTMARIP